MGQTPLGNDFWDGPVGVVGLKWNGVNLGKTNADTTISTILAFTEVMHNDDGTEFYDKVFSGKRKELACTLSEITSERLALLMDSFEKSAGGSTKEGRKLFHSMRDQAAELEIYLLDEDSEATTDPLFICKAPLAYPEQTSEFTRGPGVQTSVSFTFHLFYDPTQKCFIYTGAISSF